MGLLLGRTNEKKHASSKRVLVPRARTDELVIEELGAELLIYDSANHRAHSLGATATTVWRACDGLVTVEAMAEKLDLSETEVRHALEELEGLDLFEASAIPVVQSGNGNGNKAGITRRQMTMRSLKTGAAVVTVPLVYSINVNPALATLTPTPFQCELYTTQDCGTSAGCASIFGCCCCCQGGGSCKTCGSSVLCENGVGQPCAPIQGGGTGSNCSSVGGSHPADATGCCGVSGAKQCGCGFGTGAGCCTGSTTTNNCNPGDANCYPCCNGVKLTSANSLGCCKSTSHNCCTDPTASCCVKSGYNVDCCTHPTTACCVAGNCPQHA